MVLGAVPRFERFFRLAAELRVDKEDLRRFEEFVRSKVADVLLAAQLTAGANGRDIVEPYDLVIAKGLQERMHEYRKLDADVDIRDMLSELAAVPQSIRSLSAEAEQRLPDIAGGIAVALARLLRTVDTRHRHPGSDDWSHAEAIFNLLV